MFGISAIRSQVIIINSVYSSDRTILEDNVHVYDMNGIYTMYITDGNQGNQGQLKYRKGASMVARSVCSL